MKETATTAQPQKTGLNCPQCGGFIETSIFQLLTSRSLQCPHCRLQLTIDRNKSRQAFEALYKVQQAQENLEKKSKFSR